VLHRSVVSFIVLLCRSDSLLPLSLHLILFLFLALSSLTHLHTQKHTRTHTNTHTNTLIHTLQAILPLRGKILNIEKASTDKIYQNTELQSLIAAIGLGVRGAHPPLFLPFFYRITSAFQMLFHVLTSPSYSSGQHDASYNVIFPYRLAVCPPHLLTGTLLHPPSPCDSSFEHPLHCFHPSSPHLLPLSLIFLYLLSRYRIRHRDSKIPQHHHYDGR
jgi:hypothetical protein